jgi:hypothetical protein
MTRASGWLPRGNRLLRGAAALVLIGLLWRTALLFAGAAACGLPLPHNHVLVGHAGPADLEAHLQAERDCLADDAHHSRDNPAPRNVLSLNTTAAMHAGLLLTVTLAVLGLRLLGPQAPVALARQSLPTRAGRRSRLVRPPVPPPDWLA